ncbi:MAG: CYTH and CHAD domain-containing protein [Micropruina sp.]
MTSIEVERKYELPSGVTLPTLAGAGEQREHHLVATYYDTPDFHLAWAGITLRRRVGGADEGWHVKSPDPSGGRAEHHAPVGSSRVPVALRALFEARIEGGPLVPVAIVDNHRTETPILDAVGREVAVLCHDRVEAQAGGRLESWVEVEVELVAGTRDDLAAIEVDLLAAGLRRAGHNSKLGRALALLPAIGLGLPAGTAGAVVGRYLAKQVATLQAGEAAVRADLPDAVHRSRVATRRMRSALRTFGRLYKRTAARHLREELAWHAERLGAPRDAEVLAERLEATMTGLLDSPLNQAVRDNLSRTLAAEHSRAHAELTASMDTARYDRLHTALADLVADPPVSKRASTMAASLLPPLLDATLRRADSLARLAEQDPTDLVQWHEVRKAAKAARYGAETLSPAFGEPAKSLARAWERVTEAFGEVQDTVVAEELLDQLSTPAATAGEDVQPYLDLKALEVARRVAALNEGRAALVPARAASARGWTTI